MKFAEKVYLDKVYIYETYYAGGVKRVSAKHPNGKWKELWSTEKVSVLSQARLFEPSFQVCAQGLLKVGHDSLSGKIFRKFLMAFHESK